MKFNICHIVQINLRHQNLFSTQLLPRYLTSRKLEALFVGTLTTVCCHLLSPVFTCCHLLSPVVTCCHLLSPFFVLSYSGSFNSQKTNKQKNFFFPLRPTANSPTAHFLRLFPKNWAVSHFYVYHPLTSQKKSDKTHDPISLTLPCRRTDG